MAPQATNDWVLPLMKSCGRITVDASGIVLSEVYRHSMPTGIWKEAGFRSGSERQRIQIKFTPQLGSNIHVCVYRARLVWFWFNGEIPFGLEVDHKNDDSLDDSLDNLQLLDRLRNQRKITGFPGISSEQEEIILRYRGAGFSLRRIATLIGIDRGHISKFLRTK